MWRLKETHGRGKFKVGLIQFRFVLLTIVTLLVQPGQTLKMLDFQKWSMSDFGLKVVETYYLFHYALCLLDMQSNRMPYFE